MIERVRRRRFRIAKLALLCFSVFLIAGAVVAVAFIQASPTRMVGAITITADQFTDLGNGLVHAQGNIKLGDQLALTGDGAEVLFDSDTLIGRGTLSMDSTPLLSGEFRANVATGIAMPVTGASSKLAKVAGFAVAKPVEITQVDIPNATTTGKAVVSIGSPTQGATSTVNFSLFPGFLFSGALPPLDLELAGVKLQAPSGAAMSNGMISIPKVALTLPPELGGGTTTVDDFQIAAEGVSVAGVNSTFVMPEMIWGDNAFRLVNAKGALVYDGATFDYKFDVSGDLYVSVPGIMEDTKAVMAVTTVNGEPQLVGQVDGLNLTLGGVELSTGPLVVGLEGLSTPVVQITVPPEYGGMTFTVTDVSITSEGLSVGGGAFTMPDLILADGAVTITGVQAVVKPVDGTYEIAATGTINLNLPDQQEPASITLVFGSDGLQSEVKGLKINVAGADLIVKQATLDQYGLTATDAMFVLPPELGGVSGKVDKVSVTNEGLDFSTANMTLLLPDIPMGEAMTFTNNTAELKVVRSLEGDKYMLDVNSTLSISAGGQTSQEEVTFTITAGSDGSAEINGSVGGLVLDLGGPILVVNDLTISNEGLSVAEASLTFPSVMGGATVAVSDVTITAEGIALNGGAVFALPDIVITEGLSITGVVVKIVPVDGEYRTMATGTLNVQLPGNETATSITMVYGADGSMQTTATGLTLNIGGVTLALGDATVDSNGLSTTSAMVTLPPELGGITAQIGGVSIGAEGLSFSGGNMTIPLPDISVRRHDEPDRQRGRTEDRRHRGGSDVLARGQLDAQYERRR